MAEHFVSRHNGESTGFSSQTEEFGERVSHIASNVAERGRAYAGEFSSKVTEFVRRDPWTAMVVALAAGYIIAKLTKRSA